MTPAMIFESDAPLEIVRSELRALHRSLNRPVVNLAGLPVGPATAVVALHASAAGTTLAVRSVRTGQLSFFTSSEELRDSPQVALDAALSFGESMGFLFDEDEVRSLGDQGPEAAALRWKECIGEPPESAAADLQGAQSAAPRGGLADEPALEATLLEVPPPELVLSKFRRLVFGVDAGAEGSAPRHPRRCP